MKSKKLTREIVSSRYRTRQQAFWHHAGGAPKVLLQAMIMQRAAGHVVAEVEGQKIAADDMNLQRMRERTMSEMTEPVEMP